MDHPLSPAASASPARLRLFVLLTLACIVLGTGYIGWSWLRMQRADDAVPVIASTDPTAFGQVRSAPHMLFRSMVIGEDYGHVAAVSLATPAEPRAAGLPRCDRIYSASERTICVSSSEGFAGSILGPDLAPLFSFPIGGLPSRARVSPSGQYAATTSFVSGHSYAEAGFSTETLLIDIANQRVLANLEEFLVLRDGQRFWAEDFNFWGVTFANDGRRFFATLASRGTTYLVTGDIVTRRIEVLRENVECPSLAPDNTRLVFKKQIQQAGSPVWRLHVLDLATMQETPLAETRSIDDQVEWLDNGQVLYEVRGGIGGSSDVWLVPANGTGAPQLYLPRASSPVVMGR
jgi:hypothetical protein